MAVSKVRCSSCGEYFPREESYWQHGGRRACSAECLGVMMKRKRTPKARKRSFVDDGVDPFGDAKRRDGARCRWCGDPQVQMHHIAYRSEGGKDEPSNLIALCEAHHRVAHGNKRLYKPILLATIWLTYEGKQWMVPQVTAWLEHQPWYAAPVPRAS